MSTLASSLLVGRYRMVRSLGHGAMAEVWEADAELRQRKVAIKILHPHLRQSSMVERFRAEGLATARLRHPAIVTVFDTITEPNLEAIVMELVDGRTLRFVLDQRGTLPIERAIHISATVADALHAAHSTGIIHRDVKPANIILGKDGTIKITDFGIAKSEFAIDLTAIGTYIGTARYVAPEQVRGEPATERSDIYGLATVLYEMLVGHSPFSADHDDALAIARLHRDAPSVRALRPDVSPALDAIIGRALARDPRERYPTAASFAEALRRSAALTVRATPPSITATAVAPVVAVATAPAVDPTTVVPTVAAASTPSKTQMAEKTQTAAPDTAESRRRLRHLVATIVLWTIIVGAIALAMALLAGSHSFARLLAK